MSNLDNPPRTTGAEAAKDFFETKINRVGEDLGRTIADAKRVHTRLSKKIREQRWQVSDSTIEDEYKLIEGLGAKNDEWD